MAGRIEWTVLSLEQTGLQHEPIIPNNYAHYLPPCPGSIMLFVLLLPGCSKIPAPTAYPSTAIPTGPGPEDLVQQGDRLLISCRGEMDLETTGNIYEFTPGAGPAKILPRKGDPDSLHFRPHGIFLSRQAGKDYLYVVNHDDIRNTHPVIKYEVFEDRLEFRERFNSPLLVSPNALAVSPDGSFFVGNDHGNRDSNLEIILGLKRANVVHYDGKGNWKIVADKLGMVTGVNRIGDRLFVSATREHKLYEFKIDDGTLSEKKVFAKFRGPDNIRFHENQLITAGHFKGLAFMKHMKDTLQPSPSVVARFNPDHPEAEILFSDPGNTISTGSGAVILKDRLYIPQVFRSYILAVEIPEK